MVVLTQSPGPRTSISYRVMARDDLSTTLPTLALNSRIQASSKTRTSRAQLARLVVYPPLPPLLCTCLGIYRSTYYGTVVPRSRKS